jgi:hypothetical protein
MAESSPSDPRHALDDATRLERADRALEQRDRDDSKDRGWNPFERITKRFFPMRVDYTDEAEFKRRLALLVRCEHTKLSADSGLVTTAQERFRRDFEILERVERRAAALMGTLPIAATFTLAGGALILDSARTCGVGWRIALALAFVLPIVALTAATFFSALAAVRRRPLHYPDADAVLKFAEGNVSEAWRHYVSELLTAQHLNTRVREWNVARVRTATFYFELALLGILVAAVVMAVYVIAARSC